MITQTQFNEKSAEFLDLDQAKLNSLSEFEVLVRSKTRQVIRSMIAQWLAACEELEPQPQTMCRECGSLANFVSKRVTVARTQYGLVRYRRAYYVCPRCHAPTCPLDERINPVESLAKLRAKIAAGKSLPVAEMADAWGLGSLNMTANTPGSSAQFILQSIRVSTDEMEHYPQSNLQFDVLSIS
jgi:hypothetical protein